MDKIEQALEALEQMIKEREAADKNRKHVKRGQDAEIISDWTLTQLHIVAIIKDNEGANNTTLSETLNISKPAVTKAVKKLLDQQMIEKVQKPENKKEVYYQLTHSGEMLAYIHGELHEQARSRYIEMFEKFNSNELDTIIRFLKTLTESIKSN